MKVSYLLLAEGFEEIEALATTDMVTPGRYGNKNSIYLSEIRSQRCP